MKACTVIGLTPETETNRPEKFRQHQRYLDNSFYCETEEDGGLLMKFSNQLEEDLRLKEGRVPA